MIIFKKLLPIFIIIGFVILKFQDLFLPYFWDEAWSYFPAINEMVVQGPSLIPNSIDPELYRGHPLMFYFLSSSWMTIFGEEIWIAKSFSLVVSVLTLVSVYLFTKRNFDYITAFLSLFFLTIQSVFFAQASFLLPEMLLALFTVLSIKAFFEKKKILTLLFLTLALYTKESGIVIWGTILFFEFLAGLKTKSIKGFFSQTVYLLIPILLVAVFFIAQKLIVGWYFFPEHISYLSLETFILKTEKAWNYLFIGMGRNMITLTGAVALIILLITKNKLITEKKKEIKFLSFFILLYLIFSALNFYSPRYLLSVLPFSLILFIYFIKSVLKNYSIVFTVLAFILLVINIHHFNINSRSGTDHSFGYKDIINVQQKMISFCEQSDLYENEISAQFLLDKYLKNIKFGFLEKGKPFHGSKNYIHENTEFAIMSSNEFIEKEYESLMITGKLIKRFEQNNCWIELYKMK